jgi:hypothetical protein
MKTMKKFLCLTLCICSLLLLSFNVSAASIPDQSKSLAAYQAVMDKINTEYGTDYHFPSADELAKANLSNPTTFDKSTISVKKFEDELRQSAEALATDNANAKFQWQAAVTKADAEDSAPSVNASISPAPALELVTHGTKALTGGSAYFEGWENNNNGYWMWEYLNTTSVTTDYNNTSKQFFLDSYNYSYLDGKRTCAVNYVGTLYTKVLVWWIPASSTQYLEWYAGM